jgi:hypothetical protein
MLAVAAPFPHPGSRAYLKGTGEAREVIQQNADGTPRSRSCLSST